MHLTHQLVAITGTSFGVGKTVLTAGLAEALNPRGVQARVLDEDSLLAAGPFARFNQEIGESDPNAITTLLEASRRLAAQHAGDAILIVDALLPGCFWLLGRHPAPAVAAFLRDLRAALQPLRPLVVYLQGDPDRLLERAGAARGPGWEQRIIEALCRWRLPHYPGMPLRYRGDVIRYLVWLEEQTLRLLTSLGYDLLVLDAEARRMQQIDAVVGRLRIRSDVAP